MTYQAPAYSYRVAQIDDAHEDRWYIVDGDRVVGDQYWFSKESAIDARDWIALLQTARVAGGH